MSSHADLYFRPLREVDFFVGERRFLLKPGLGQTYRDVGLHDRRFILGAAADLLRERGLELRDIDQGQLVMEYYAQVRWYRAKGVEPPEKVLARFEDAVQLANTAPPVPTTSGEVAMSDEVNTEKPATRRGARPYCLKLIDAGTRDEHQLLEEMHRAGYGTFKMGDVRGMLRVAGVLPWTTRKGKVRRSAPKSEETPA